jgi:hypothetical protein
MTEISTKSPQADALPTQSTQVAGEIVPEKEALSNGLYQRFLQATDELRRLNLEFHEFRRALKEIIGTGSSLAHSTGRGNLRR